MGGSVQRQNEETHILCVRSCVIGKPQNQSRPQRKYADEEAWDKCNFHDTLLD